MNSDHVNEKGGLTGAVICLISCLVIMVGAVVAASLVQEDFGRVEVSNVRYSNTNGIAVRAKLLRPVSATRENRMPGVVYIHGYQNNRETGDAYCIEMARRGFVVLNIDAIGRGNSGIPNDPKAPDFDQTYGGRSSLEYLRGLPFVNPDSVGMMGHSMGGEMAYRVALEDPGVEALVISGFAYTREASRTRPRNMLMIFGKWDEFRGRMTGTRDFEKEWMKTPVTAQVIGADDPRLGVTYGAFADGSARRVFMPRITHVQESHHSASIAEAVEWMRKALKPPADLWIDSGDQTWAVKEWATLAAMCACFASLLPLGFLLLRIPFFRPVSGSVSGRYACTGGAYFRIAALNGVLMWFYLPFILVLFGIHVKVVHIDGVFPLMMVNGVVWWFFWINVIGFFIFRRWFRKRSAQTGLTLADLGISFKNEGFGLDRSVMAGSILLAALLFAFAYLSEHILENIFIVDFRFIFPFASDLTPYRALLCLLYFPFILAGFLGMGILLHGQLRRKVKETRLGTFFSWSITNTLALIVPLILFMLIQYVPLLVNGFIPLVGPGGSFIAFVQNLFHIIVVLIMTTPISTWFYQLTGRIYVGAMVNAMLVTWMFVSSQVIAPIPV